MPHPSTSFRRNDGNGRVPKLFLIAVGKRRKYCHGGQDQFFRLAEFTAEQRAALLRRSESDLPWFVKKFTRSSRRFGGRVTRHCAICAGLRQGGSDHPGHCRDAGGFSCGARRAQWAIAGSHRFRGGNIRRFHEKQKPEEMWMKEIRPGVLAGDRATPIPSVACYIPRGKGAFPSSVLMTCIPARVAGVEDICIITPPGPDGRSTRPRWLPPKRRAYPKSTRRAGRRASRRWPMEPKPSPNMRRWWAPVRPGWWRPSGRGRCDRYRNTRGPERSDCVCR